MLTKTFPVLFVEFAWIEGIITIRVFDSRFPEIPGSTVNVLAEIKLMVEISLLTFILYPTSIVTFELDAPDDRLINVTESPIPVLTVKLDVLTDLYAGW